MAERRPPRTAIAKIDRNVSIPMRDGTVLMADIYFPRAERETFSAILIRTPYGKDEATEQAGPLAKFLATQGFVVIAQDIRGTGQSEGTFKAYSNIEGPDGYDTLEWLCKQSWCNGNIGTVGCSYHGEVQDMLAAECHPAHKAAFIEGSYTYNNGGMRAFSFVRYGALELAYALGTTSEHLKTLPVADILAKADKKSLSYYATHWPETVQAWLTEDPASAYWDNDGGLPDGTKFNVPAIHMNEWYSLPFSSIKMFELFRSNAKSQTAADNQFLIMSPMTHCRTSAGGKSTVVGERDLGDTRIDYFGIMVDWFDHWLEGVQNGVTDMPRVQSYLMGKNEWKGFTAWPPEETQEYDFYLTADGKLEKFCTPEQSALRYYYDPQSPVPSLGGPVNAGAVLRAGGYDQSQIEERGDVLVFTSELLTSPVQISGEIKVVLFVSSDCPDTDFTAKLVDVYPDGRAFNLAEGIVRMRYRNGITDPELMEPGHIYEIEIDLDSTCNWFSKGHAIRLEVSSSNFPRFDRNLNTGDNNAFTNKTRIASNQVLFGVKYPSRVILPLTPVSND